MTEHRYGEKPELVANFNHLSMDEVMYYLYLPVFMKNPKMKRCEGRDVTDIRLPGNLELLRPMIKTAVMSKFGGDTVFPYKYIYVSARKGWATRDNPLNRPGWHCDGFGSDDMNFIWWKGKGTRFAVQKFVDISEDHVISMKQFQDQLQSYNIQTSMFDQWLYHISPYVVHATPDITTPGMRQFVKISFSNDKYNLYNNSHNYAFDYKWDMVDRSEVRNDTSKAQGDKA